MIDFSSYQFHAVVFLPKEYCVYDFSKGLKSEPMTSSLYGIGKYNEKRQNMYTGELYTDGRDIHMGIDIAAPIGTPVYSFYSGEVYKKAYNSKHLDYGYTIICKYTFDGVFLYALYGHLSKRSYDSVSVGQFLNAGDILGWMGSSEENGGWPSHLHFQLSYEEPIECDMPGVVHEKDLEKALKIYPDPRCVLGNLY